MEANRSLGPTCVLKVNINCCKACPVKLRKKLQKIYGVSSVLIHKEKDLVIVSGNIDPTKLVEAIKRIGKKNAEILSYEKDPSLVQQKLNHLFNKIHSAHYEDSDFVVDDDEGDDVDHDESSDEFAHHNNIHKLKRGHGSHRHQYLPHHYVHGKGSETIGGRVFGNPSAAAAIRGYGHVPAGLPPTRPPYGYQGYDHYQPVMYARPPPPAYYDFHGPINLPPLGASLQPAYNPYYKQRDPPNGNSVFHYFSEDNIKACTIM